MKLLTWNVNHRIHEKVIPHLMAEAIDSLKPDIIVLTEFVDGPSRKSFFSELKSFGFSDKRVSKESEGQNQVLIASRTPLVDGAIQMPRTPSVSASDEELIPEAFPSNILHVHVPDKGFEILGLRVPMPLKSLNRRACWEWITKTAQENSERPFVLIGDFNIDPRYPPAKCEKRFDMLKKEGWQHADAVPLSDVSYFPPAGGPGTRLDHAFLSKHFINPSARYVSESGGFVFAGKKPGAMSDHAILLVDSELKL